MPRTTIAMPFARTVRIVGDARPSVTVVDVLPVSVEALPDKGQPHDATETFEGDTRHVIVVHGGKPYEGYRTPWTGLPVDSAARRIKADIERRLSPVPHEWLEGKRVLDDGKAAQAAERDALERITVSSRGRLYALTHAPVIDLSLELGQVVVNTGFPREKRPPAWMRFSLDRRMDAKKMASQLSKALGDGAWRGRGSWPVNAMSFSHWMVKSPGEYAGIGYAHGGDGSVDEKEAAFAAAVVEEVSPVVGRLPVSAIRAFADLREAMEAGGPVREPVEAFAAALRDMPVPDGSDEALFAAKLAGICLAMRLDDWEPRADLGPRP